GDDRVLIERYLERPRHIEIQVFADSHGNVVHLFERDCSIQRRYQKIVEEAPAPGLAQQMRQAMAQAAVAAARAVGYVGAGTVEFIVERDRFYFMEMNTRLQVEHPVTEAVTGLDLVEWQLRVAAGEKLPLGQDEISAAGHAIEVRLYAEDPDRGFLPQTGTLYGLRLPPPETARVDTGVRQGDRVTADYDPMIAKIVVWGENRAAAVGRLHRALTATAVHGLRTNLGLLARVAAAPEFVAGAVDTGFIERNRAHLLPPPRPAPDEALFAAALNRLATRAEQIVRDANDPHSPWTRNDGWRLGGTARQDVVFDDGGTTRTVEAEARGRGWSLRLGEQGVLAGAETGPNGSLALTLDGVRRQVLIFGHDAEISVHIAGEEWRLAEIDPLAARLGEDPAAGRLTAPMPGRVAELLVAPGDKVRRGQRLVVIEAMKMEHAVAAPADGTVERVRYAVGDLVEEGAELVVLTEPGRGRGDGDR
ncbi:MAG TPA: biotin/lipoyl-containing protein, partial [Stellaceae bacterium]